MKSGNKRYCRWLCEYAPAR